MRQYKDFHHQSLSWCGGAHQRAAVASERRGEMPNATPRLLHSLSKGFLCSDLIGGRRKSRKHSGYSYTSKVERTELKFVFSQWMIKENFPDLGRSNLQQLECHCLGWKRWSKPRRRHLDTGFECPLNLLVARLNRHLCLSPEFSKDV